MSCKLQAVLFIACFFSASVSAAPQNTLLIRQGYLLPMTANGQDQPSTDILIRNNQIVQIGKNLVAADAKIIDARGKYVMPGFVDAHNHLWVTTMRGQFRNKQGKFFPVSNKLAKKMQPDDIWLAMYSGSLELLQSGITTTGDFFDNIHGPAWGDAGFRALEKSGIRAIMYYGGPDKTTKRMIDLTHLAELKKQSTDRVQLGLGWRIPRDLSSQQNWAMRDKEYRFAVQHNLPIQVHVSGDARAMFDALIDRQYLSPSLTVIHASDALPQQLNALQKSGGGLVLTPVSEQRVGYGLTLLNHFEDVERQGLGIDGNALSGGANMFETLRTAALTESGKAKDETLPDARQLLALATRRSAESIGLGELTGTLEEGKRADIQIIIPNTLNMAGFGGGDPAALIVYSAQPENVETVIVDGRIIKADGKLQGINLEEQLRATNASAKKLLEHSESQM
ncbi:cytosine/adenosine deaminase-related metal-dependent hydrolase [Pantoea sp. AG1095]|uniref:amidohydrolase family protein n=1 Tax=Pantoea sp. AG1095 TaxID=2184004 RepID=UPI000D903992|nr:amidohydrolase family protein [Pantoea sp. AG1095]PYG46029.1 cytosine/adenosine deaminase-related metal-dependent hydrolase [Pantoea sp. AG1095]